MDCRNDDEPWDWQGGDYSLQKDSNTNMPDRLWNEEHMPSMFNETTTPVKACVDLTYHVSHNEAMNKELEDRRETCSQVKRRRMLQFNTEAIGSPNCNEDMSSVFLKSNERLDFAEEMSQWVSGFSDASASASNLDAMDQSSEGWLAECLNDTEMTFSPDDMNFSGETDVQIDINEFCPPEHQAKPVQQRVSRPPKNVVFRGVGRKSYIRPPTKLASSIAYPFAFIKPCGIHGDVTLKDINQRIRTPPPSKSKQSDEDDLTASFPTSAFSGKPVVGKTKIRTEGGKGSITIMRTKG